MRLFLALHIQPDRRLREIYFQIKRLLARQRVKFYPLEEMFLILRFLPDSEQEFLSDINRIIAGQIANSRKFSIQIEGVDIYPYKILPKVLWFRITEEPILRSLAEGLDKDLTHFGYAPEEFAFYPHITFARIRKLDNTKAIDLIEERFASFEPIVFDIDQVILFESIPTTGHTTYRVRNRFDLPDVQN
jgi:2'-5' RNA ligase